ncbi:MAG: LamG domain-containing protein, partial [Nitrososphaera sp.]|nr:LamG domain-containing protein [Nitrososphaera sp.]
SATASGAAAITMVLNAGSGQLSFWAARDPDATGTSAYGSSILPFGLIGLVRVGDQFYGWNQRDATNQGAMGQLTLGPPVGTQTLSLNHFNGIHDTTDPFTDEINYNQWANTDSAGLFSTTQSKFGGSSVTHTAESTTTLDVDSLAANDTTAWTVECFIRTDSATTSRWRLFLLDSSDNFILEFEIERGPGDLTAQINNTAGDAAVTLTSTGQTINADTWYHVAVERNSGTYTMWLDGVVKDSDTSVTGTPRSGIASARIVLDPATSETVFADEFRCSNVARYAGAGFTPTTTAFTVD